VASTLEVPKATLREWIGLAVLALPCLLYSMDLTVLNLALPALSEDLRPSSSELLWIVDIYGFFVAGSLITMGTLGDRIGRRRMLLMGAAAFGVASVVAAFSTSATMLIATRALLGFAGATLAPSTLSLVRNMFLEDRQRTLAIGIWITSYSVGAAIGPLIGGVVLQYFWWGSVFLIGVPVMLLLLVLGPILLPEFRDPSAGKLDLVSAGLSLAAILLAIYALKRVAEHGLQVGDGVVLLFGLTAGAAFVRRQLTLAEPLIDLRLFRAPAFNVSLAAYLLATFAAFGGFVFISQYLQLVFGLSPLEAGVLTMPWALSFVVGSIATPAITRHIRPAVVMSVGLVVATLGFGLLTQSDAGNGTALLVIATVVIALGLAPVFTLATDLVIGSAPVERAGAAAAISETSSEFGGALGIAILGSLGAAVYRSHMRDAIPASVAPEAADAARSTLAGAAAVAEHLPGTLGAEVLGAGRLAFTQSFDLASIVTGGVVLLTAAFVAIVLRDERSNETENQPMIDACTSASARSSDGSVLSRSTTCDDSASSRGTSVRTTSSLALTDA
jgi:MFS transporter, DHA2 family, multidrug resistance protein